MGFPTSSKSFPTSSDRLGKETPGIAKWNHVSPTTSRWHPENPGVLGFPLRFSPPFGGPGRLSCPVFSVRIEQLKKGPWLVGLYRG